MLLCTCNTNAGKFLHIICENNVHIILGMYYHERKGAGKDNFC